MSSTYKISTKDSQPLVVQSTYRLPPKKAAKLRELCNEKLRIYGEAYDLKNDIDSFTAELKSKKWLVKSWIVNCFMKKRQERLNTVNRGFTNVDLRTSVPKLMQPLINGQIRSQQMPLPSAPTSMPLSPHFNITSRGGAVPCLPGGRLQTAPRPTPFLGLPANRPLNYGQMSQQQAPFMNFQHNAQRVQVPQFQRIQAEAPRHLRQSYAVRVSSNVPNGPGHSVRPGNAPTHTFTQTQQGPITITRPMTLAKNRLEKNQGNVQQPAEEAQPPQSPFMKFGQGVADEEHDVKPDLSQPPIQRRCQAERAEAKPELRRLEVRVPMSEEIELTPQAMRLHLPESGQHDCTRWTQDDVVDWASNFLDCERVEILKESQLNGRVLRTMLTNESQCRSIGFDHTLWYNLYINLNKVINVCSKLR